MDKCPKCGGEDLYMGQCYDCGHVYDPDLAKQDCSDDYYDQLYDKDMREQYENPVCDYCGETLNWCECQYEEEEYCPECGEEIDICYCNEVGSRWDDDYMDYPEYDNIDFADPGGRSALRAATPDNPRNLPCPTCGAENVLTPADVSLGYQCDRCADAAERGY